MSRVSSPLRCVCSWALWAEPMSLSLPGLAELSYRKIPNNSLALLLSSSDRRWSSVLFFCQSLILLRSTGKFLAAASPEFSSAYFTTESLNFKSYFLFFCYTRPMAISVILTDRKQAQYVKKGKKNVQWPWAHLVPLFKKKIIKKSDSAIIWNRRLFTKIYTCNRCLKGTLRLITTWLLFGNVQ